MSVSQRTGSPGGAPDGAEPTLAPLTLHPRDAELLGWLSGALEPGEAHRLAGELAASPKLRLRLAELRARVEEDLDAPSDALHIPPPGVRGSKLPVQATVEPQGQGWGFAGEEAAPTRVRLMAPDAQRRLLVLLRRVEGAWRVVLPAHPDELTALQDMELDGDGYVLVLFSDEPGVQRYAVALPLPGQADPSWDEPEKTRWIALFEAIQRGEVPVFSLDVGGPAAPDPRTAKTGA